MDAETQQCHWHVHWDLEVLLALSVYSGNSCLCFVLFFLYPMRLNNLSPEVLRRKNSKLNSGSQVKGCDETIGSCQFWKHMTNSLSRKQTFHFAIYITNMYIFCFLTFPSFTYIMIRKQRANNSTVEELEQQLCNS